MAERGKYKVPAKMVAHATKTSDELVHKVRAGKRGTGAKAKKVAQADALLDEGVNKLIEEVNRIVNF